MPSMGKLGQWFKQELPQQKYNASFGGAYMLGHEFRYETYRVPTPEITARIETGATVNSYISAGRVIAGGLVFGVIGAGVGAMARKGGTRIYVVIERNGEIIGTLEESAEKESRARKFIETLEASKRSAG